MFGTVFASICRRLTSKRGSPAVDTEALPARPTATEIKLGDDNRSALKAAIMEVYERFATRALRADDTVPWPAEAASARHWMTHAYASKKSYEDDAVVFAKFHRDMGAILDIGAHWGYTALSIRRFGSNCPIISFEASDSHAECLDEFRKLDSNYDFLVCALGELVGGAREKGDAVFLRFDFLGDADVHAGSLARRRVRRESGMRAALAK